jgi:hypothetical protein
MLPPVDIAYITEELRTQTEELVEVFEDGNSDTDPDPRVLLHSLNELFADLHRLDEEVPRQTEMEVQTRSTPKKMRILGDRGIDLLTRLAALAGRLRLPRQAHAIEELTLPLACWVARRGGELGHIGPVVDGAATLANRIDQPSELGRLYALLTEVVDAVDLQVSQDKGPSSPWRLLLLNRAIVATRSHRPELMEDAFEAIVEHLPEDAPIFFREGMEQMNALGYPHQARTVMQRYYDQWCKQRVLH